MVRAHGNGNVVYPREGQYPQSIAGGLFQGLVAGNNGHRLDLQLFRLGKRPQHCQGVVMSGVTVHNNRDFPHIDPPVLFCRNMAAIPLIVLNHSELHRFQFGCRYLIHGGSRSSCSMAGYTDTRCFGSDLHGLLHRTALCLACQEEAGEYIACRGGIHNGGIIGRVTDHLVRSIYMAPRRPG